jgi:hypothetical protein
MYIFDDNDLVGFQIMDSETGERRLTFETLNPDKNKYKGSDYLQAGVQTLKEFYLKKQIEEQGKEIVKLKEQIKNLKESSVLKTPKELNFVVRGEWGEDKIRGIQLRGRSLVYDQSTGSYLVNTVARVITQECILQKTTSEDLKPGDVFFDDEILPKYLNDAENYGVVLQDKTVAFWNCNGVLVEPSIQWVGKDLYKVVYNK